MKAKILAALTIAFWFGFQTCAYAFDATITSTSDKTSANSLRGAILRANKFGGNNIIILARNHYQLTISGADEDACRTGDLDITRGNLTITGLSRSQVTIDATGLGDRVFHVLPGAHLTLVNLVVTGGSAPNGSYFLNNFNSDGENGGGIYNAGVLTLKNCIISGNSGGMGDSGSIGTFIPGGNGGNGGGIYNIGKLIANNSTVSNNFCGMGGAGIVLPGDIGSSGGTGGSGGNGGGIYNGGILTLNSCAIIGNFCGNGGEGPAANRPGNGGNGGDGGGIFNTNILTLNFCIVTGNANGDGGDGGDSEQIGGTGGNGGAGGSGGGVSNMVDGSHAKLFNTLIDLNSFGEGGMGGAGGLGFPDPNNTGLNGIPGVDGSSPNLFGDFTISQ